MFDWLTNDTRVVDFSGDALEKLTCAFTLVENSTLRDVVHSIVGARVKRGNELMPMNAKQCDRLLRFSKSILDCLNAYNWFSAAKKVSCFVFFFLIDISFFALI